MVVYSRPANGRPTNAQLFQLVIDIEHKAGEIYASFTRIFAHIKEVSKFWETMKEDECEHKKFLQFILVNIPEENLSQHADLEIWNKISEAHLFLGKNILDQIKNLDDAYEFAHELEFTESDAMFKFIASNIISDEETEKDLLDKISSHQDRLMNFGRIFSDKIYRRQIPAVHNGKITL